MPNTKLSISLIKQGVSIDSIVKEGTDRIELSKTYALFYKRNNPSSPNKQITDISNAIVSIDITGKRRILLYKRISEGKKPKSNHCKINLLKIHTRKISK